MSHPPSQAVIEAVEQAEREHRWFEWCGNHPDGEFCCECGTHDTSPHHRRFEVARAAEAAALRAAADDYFNASSGTKARPHARSWLRARANKLTDTDDRSKP